MLLAINQNLYSSRNRKGEKEEDDKEHQAQQQVDEKEAAIQQQQQQQQQCPFHFSTNDEYGINFQYPASEKEPITATHTATTNFLDNMLLKSAAQATREAGIAETREAAEELPKAKTVTTRNCKNTKHDFESNVFAQQQQRKQQQKQQHKQQQKPQRREQQLQEYQKRCEPKGQLQLQSQQQQQMPHMTLEAATETDTDTEMRQRDFQARGCAECHCLCDGAANKWSHSAGNSTSTNYNNSNTNNTDFAKNWCNHQAPPQPPSLHVVYLCLGTLALAVAALALLFHSHVSSPLADDESSRASLLAMPPTGDLEVVPFREQFRSELLASDDMLRSIVAQIMLQQERQTPSGASSPPAQPPTPPPPLPPRRQQRREVVQEENRNQRPSFNFASSDSLPDETATATATLTSMENFRYRSTKLPYDATEIVKNERKFTRSISSGSSSSGVSSSRGVSSSSGFSSRTGVSNQSGGPNHEAVALASNRRQRRDISSPSSMHADPFIEFFNPNHRKVLEEQDVEIRKRTGSKGAAPGGDEWIYLNTYCRVPEKIITGFCKGTQEYCPPSPAGPVGPIGPKGSTGSPGLPGIPGPKGNRGDVGLPGPPGLDGGAGVAGPRGPKGDIGIPGRVGLDGRDGVPGEPGLDGVPGRAGADGIPGKDGLAGRDGRDGLNGKDGKNGATGPKGAPGPPGERGLKGIAGPRGRPGKAGINGTPGIPGINAWKVQLQNGSFSSDLLVPPSIADLNAPHIHRTVIVEEGKTLNLSCAATGHPVPHVEWRRDDGRTINVHGIEMSSVSGSFLKFSNITRNQMAAYTCFANNGIAPVANATFLVEVHFSPMISVYRQMIYAEYGRAATLECLVEAFPEAIRYWERAYDGKILDPGEKYRIETYPDGFKTTMRLTINNLRKDDFGYYHCVARNELNATMVNFEIAPQDPNSETPYVGKEIRVFGQRPPESECPICEQCPDPGLYQCKDAINSIFEIQPTGNGSYPGLPKRQKSCLLYAVGKPVFHKAINEIHGCWLKDAAAKDIDREKTFVTKENDTTNLYEFSTKMQFRMSSIARNKYDIPEGFHGNAHVVYNGSFYYHQLNTDKVVKMNLNTLKKISTSLPYSGIASGNKLYSTHYNFMDFNVDEVGLWVIYSTSDSNNTLVAKLDAENLKMQYNFNITLDHHKFGEMFIVCGHLYAIDSCTDNNSQIRYVVDLYNGKLLNVDLPFSNPFRRTTTVGYNPFTVELYSVDKGNALTYPIRYNEQSLNALPHRS